MDETSPASILFAECQRLCREATAEYYEQEPGGAAEDYEIVPIETMLKDANNRLITKKVICRQRANPRR